MTGGPPTKLRANHKFAALLIAMGWKQRRAAKKIGMSENRLSIICQSPLFQTIVTQYQREFIAKGMQSTIDKVLADGPANVDFIRDVRNGVQTDVREIDDPNDRLRHKLHAANILIDRQLPKKQDGDSAPKVTVVVDARQRAAMEDACFEAGQPIDVTPAGQKRLAPPVAALIPRNLDDVIEEYMERELAQGE